MLIGVRSEAVLGEQLDDLVKHLVVPFCRDQNQAGQASGVFFNVGTRARHLDCSNFRMSDWVESNPVVAQTVAIEESCNSVQQGNYGVRCAMMTVEGTPALILSYASDAGALDNLVGITREVGGSFCQLSLATSVPATIVLLDEQFVGRFYDCSTARLSEPIPFVKQRRQPVAPAPATPQPSKPVPANTRPANTVLASLDQRWDLLPQRR